MRALSKLVLRQNDIHGAQAGRVFADMLAQNTILKELDLSSQAWSTHSSLDAAFANEFAVGLSDNGALSSANLLGNDIGIEQASALAVILKEHPTLKSLCGNKGDETELDMSGKNMRVEGAIMLVPEIIDNGALTSLDLSNNNIGQLVMSNGWQEDADGYRKEVDGEEIVEMQIPAGEQLATESPVGAIAIANAVKDMRALTKLDISNNNIEQGEALQRIADLCNTKSIELDNHESESESESGSGSDGDYY